MNVQDYLENRVKFTFAKTMASTQYEILKKTSEHLNKLKESCDIMLEERKKANKLTILFRPIGEFI